MATPSYTVDGSSKRAQEKKHRDQDPTVVTKEEAMIDSETSANNHIKPIKIINAIQERERERKKTLTKTLTNKL